VGNRLPNDASSHPRKLKLEWHYCKNIVHKLVKWNL
jgi:hypothetical protein